MMSVAQHPLRVYAGASVKTAEFIAETVTASGRSPPLLLRRPATRRRRKAGGTRQQQVQDRRRWRRKIHTRARKPLTEMRSAATELVTVTGSATAEGIGTATTAAARARAREIVRGREAEGATTRGGTGRKARGSSISITLNPDVSKENALGDRLEPRALASLGGRISRIYFIMPRQSLQDP